MVAGGDDREEGEDGVGDDQPAPSARAEQHDAEADEQRPRHVHRRHRRQLVGSGSADGRVHGLVVQRAGVDEPEAGREAGRRDRNELDRERRTGDDHHRVAHLRVVVTVPDEHPDEERDHRREVERRVEDVQRLREQRRVEHLVLEPELARDVQVVLDVEDPAGPGDRAVDLQQRERARELPQRVQPEHDGRLPGERQREPGLPAARPREQAEDHEQGHDGERDRERQRCFPGQPHDPGSVREVASGGSAVLRRPAHDREGRRQRLGDRNGHRVAGTERRRVGRIRAGLRGQSRADGARHRGRAAVLPDGEGGAAADADRELQLDLEVRQRARGQDRERHVADRRVGRRREGPDELPAADDDPGAPARDDPGARAGVTLRAGEPRETGQPRRARRSGESGQTLRTGETLSAGRAVGTGESGLTLGSGQTLQAACARRAREPGRAPLRDDRPVPRVRGHGAGRRREHRHVRRALIGDDAARGVRGTGRPRTEEAELRAEQAPAVRGRHGLDPGR